MERREIEKERLQHELRESDDKLNRQVEGKILNEGANRDGKPGEKTWKLGKRDGN